MDIDLISNITFGGIEWNGYPDFSDIYVESADYNGRAMDGYELDELNRDTKMIYELYTRKNG